MVWKDLYEVSNILLDSSRLHDFDVSARGCRNEHYSFIDALKKASMEQREP